MFKNIQIINSKLEDNEKIINLHNLIKIFNGNLQKFLINQKEFYGNINDLENNFISGNGVDESKYTEIANIYEDLKINSNENKKNLNLEDLNKFILDLIDNHNKLDENLDELLVKLDSQMKS